MSTGMEPAIIIAVVCFILAAISKLIQRKFLDKAKMDSLKSQIKEKQKEMKSLMKGGNQEKIAKAQKELMEINMQMMQSTNKVMLISLPIFLLFFGLLSYFFAGITFQSIIPLPKFIEWNLLNPASWIPVGLTMTTGYYKAYFFYYMIFTILLTIITKIIDKTKK